MTFVSGIFELVPWPPQQMQDPKGPFVKCFDSDGKAVKINLGKQIPIPNKPTFEHASYDDYMKVAGTPPIDTTRLAAALDRLSQAVRESIPAVTQAAFETYPILSDDDLREAKRLEDLIEDTLEKEYDTNNPTKEIIVPAVGVDAAIVKWLSKRYPAWDMVYIKGQFRMVPHDCREQKVQ